MDRLRKLILSFLVCIIGGGISLAQNTVKVSGTVTSASDGEPLVGAGVVAGSGAGTITSLDGDYVIEAAPGTKLIFSSIGFADEEFIVPSGSAEIRHNVSLKAESTLLDDVVVVAYGVKKKGTITGSVSSIKSDKIENTPTAAFDQALQGQVPGLSVMASTGEPSVAAKMLIRGTNSINSGTAPLYILDGAEISSADFNTINPSDIASISVLKDASSTSIYGARASNGVIVITTKRGDIGRPVINFRTQLGLSDVTTGKWNLMDTEQRIRYEKEIGMDTGKDYSQLAGIDMNWMDVVFEPGFLQSYELSVSGATDKTNYFVSGSYYDQDGIAPGSRFSRVSIRANIEQQAAKWLRIGTNTLLNYQGIEQASEGEASVVTPISAAQFMLPYWNPYRKDGSWASSGDGSWNGDGINPMEWLDNNPLRFKKYKVFSSLFAEATPIKGLTIKSQFTLDYSHTTGFGQSYPDFAPNQGSGSAMRSSADGLALAVTNTVNYTFDLDMVHSFNFLVGHEARDYRYESFSILTQGQTNNKLTNISAGSRATSWSDTTDDNYATVSFFGKAEYNYNSKYYLELSGRTDASSRFGASNRWGFFGSVGFMWNMRNENFMAGSRSWLTNAQISLNTGTSGNSSIPNYEHLALVGGSGDYVGYPGLVPVSQGNEKLGWEKSWTTNLGLHFGFWNRLNADIELYNKTTTDLLMAVPKSYSDNGFGSRWDNIGKMSNMGAELNLSGALIQTRDFLWMLNANVSYNRNRIKELYDGVQEYEISSSNLKLKVGHDYGEYYINRFAFVNPANGDALWYDKDGNLTNELKDEDKVMIGKSMNAPWQGGFGTSFSWKGLSLSAQFSWIGDRWVINNDRFFQESNGRFSSYNQSVKLLDRWQKPGDVSDTPRHGVYMEFDDRLLEDASFLRLKNLMLGYTFPKDMLAKTRVLSGLRIYVQAQNLFTFTKFTGIDPEGTGNIYMAQYPMSRQYTFGIDITF